MSSAANVVLPRATMRLPRVDTRIDGAAKVHDATGAADMKVGQQRKGTAAELMVMCPTTTIHLKVVRLAIPPDRGPTEAVIEGASSITALLIVLPPSAASQGLSMITQDPTYRLLCLPAREEM